MLFNLLPICAGMLEWSGDRRKIHRRIILLVTYPLRIVFAPQKLGAIGLHLKGCLHGQSDRIEDYAQTYETNQDAH